MIGIEQKGLEQRIKQEWFNNNGNISGKRQWLGYQTIRSDCYTAKKYASDCPSCDHLPILEAVASGRADFSDAEQTLLDDLVKWNFCKKDGDRTYVNAVNYTYVIREKITDFLKETDEYKEAEKGYAKLAETVRKTVEKYANPYIADDMGYYTFMNISVRPVLARLLHDKGCYKGKSGQFCEFVY